MLSHSTVLEGPGPSSLCNRTSCFRARTAVFSSICSNWRGRGEDGDKREWFICYQNFLFLSKTLSHTHTYLSQGRFLVPQADDKDAVRLPDAALSPRGHGVVSLVQDNPIDVLLLGQPAGETVLVDTDGHRRKARVRLWNSVLIHQKQTLTMIEKYGK